MEATLAVHPVDLEPFRLGGPDAREEVARTLDQACRDSGFLVVTGHGVAPELCDDVLDVFARFFDQPLEEKRRWHVADEAANRGYSELGKEALAYSRGEATPPDLFEAFNVGREAVAGPWFDANRPFFAPNLSPSHPPGLRAAWQRYEAAVSGLADDLLQAMAIGLDLPEAWFIDQTRRAVVTTRALNYQRCPGAPEPEPEQMRLGAHTDYGIVTILLADDVAGLQVFRDGRWQAAPTPRGSFVCNIGDMLERWTNDRWTSTLHRVTPPPAHAHVVRRRSLARFLDCEPDRVVSCIPSCCSEAEPARYPPVQAGAWLQAKVVGGRSRATVDLDRATSGAI